jgi:hypothetical protein
MSLSEFIAATQAEMKTRIEEECKKQMMALLEDSFSSKWEEYTSKTVESASAVPLYTKQYGKFDIDKDTDGKPDWTIEFNAIIKQIIEKFKFTSKSVYFIHCCTKLTYNNGEYYCNGYLIDNYGFSHQFNANKKNSGIHVAASYMFPDKDVVIDITKPTGSMLTEKYTYKLPNTLIDLVRSSPCAVPAFNGAISGVYGSRDSPGGNLESIIANLPQIRKASALFHEQATATEKLLNYKKSFEATLAENKAMKARIAELEAKVKMIEASAPTEDLLGLTGSNECAAGGCGEPSKNN